MRAFTRGEKLSSSSQYAGRNYGIDAIKVIAMFMVVVLHILGKSGLLKTTVFSGQYEMAWFLEIASYCAVNCFALTTGYLLVGRETKYSRMISLWFQVVFYCVLLTVIVYLFQSEQIESETFIDGLITSFYPAASRKYWYFTAYFCLYTFYPFLNKLIGSLSKKEMKGLCLTLLVIFSIIPTVFMKDSFVTSNGYSPLWLAVMYLFGAYIKLYHPFENAGAVRCGLFYVGCVVVTWLSKLVIALLTTKFLGEISYDSILVSYVSPTIVFSAVALLLMFTRLHFPEKVGRFLAAISPLAFAVYLIHEQPFVRAYVMPYSEFLAYSEHSPIIMALCILGTAVVVYTICIVIERIRVALFDLLRVKKLADKIDSCICAFCDRINA